MFEVIWQLLLLSLIEEIGFYYSHRMFHLPFFYKRIHKQHHEWQAPISIVALYAHPIEHIVSNLTPVASGPIIVGCHIATTWLWYIIATASITIAHCGYHFPLCWSPEAHDWHHLTFTNNFGVLGILDRLHGTDAAFRKSKQYERHIFLLSLVPVKQLIPDDPKPEQSTK